ncbi:MAG TPA: hypothetical protein VFU22_11655 [Roseiflexaceae bacterium]|nr:hypothetical protein [Roseiflexaceae bacterium]
MADAPLWAAQRWIQGGNHDLRWSPALAADDEAEQTPSAEPPE